MWSFFNIGEIRALRLCKPILPTEWVSSCCGEPDATAFRLRSFIGDVGMLRLQDSADWSVPLIIRIWFWSHCSSVRELFF